MTICTAVLGAALALYYSEPAPNPVAVENILKYRVYDQLDTNGIPRHWKGRPHRLTRFWREDQTLWCDDPSCRFCKGYVYGNKRK